MKKPGEAPSVTGGRCHLSAEQVNRKKGDPFSIHRPGRRPPQHHIATTLPVADLQGLSVHRCDLCGCLFTKDPTKSGAPDS